MNLKKHFNKRSKICQVFDDFLLLMRGEHSLTEVVSMAGVESCYSCGKALTNPYWIRVAEDPKSTIRVPVCRKCFGELERG